MKPGTLRLTARTRTSPRPRPVLRSSRRPARLLRPGVPEDDAADAGARCRSDHGRASSVRSRPSDRVDHLPRPVRPIVRAPVAVDLVELRLLRRRDELEYELPPGAVEVLGQVPQARRLAAVHLRVALWVVAHEPIVPTEAADSKRANRVPPPSSGAQEWRRGASNTAGLPASPFAPRR